MLASGCIIGKGPVYHVRAMIDSVKDFQTTIIPYLTNKPKIKHEVTHSEVVENGSAMQYEENQAGVPSESHDNVYSHSSQDNVNVSSNCVLTS